MDDVSDTASVRGDAYAASAALLVLGLEHASGPRADLVTAHKWFNLAAMQGNKEAARLRLEIAVEMSQADIAAAQRAARVWLSTKTRPCAR
jgi:TPR repeat protein